MGVSRGPDECGLPPPPPMRKLYVATAPLAASATLRVQGTCSHSSPSFETRVRQTVSTLFHWLRGFKSLENKPDTAQRALPSLNALAPMALMCDTPAQTVPSCPLPL